MQKVRMVVTGEFKSPEESREAISLSMRYFRRHGLKLDQVDDVSMGENAKNINVDGETNAMDEDQSSEDQSSEDQSSNNGNA